ncbi:MAG TPA: PD-(D/E)XK nuclease family protein [Candidatus Cybelea sp.]|nr:PD-(D/E)XK nuclease family protein [Candidatus Cybelea sp.]
MVQVRLAAPHNCWAVANTPEVDAFISGAIRWCKTGEQAELERLVRSACSGVDHDVGAAYATLASRTGSLLDAIDAQRLALPAGDRDAVLAFARKVRRLRDLADTLDDDALRTEIVRSFDCARYARSAQDDSAKDAFELAEPVEPEAVGRVVARQKHFSASALNAYAECERKWFYRYACGAVEDRGSSAAAYGTAFHLALEDFHGDFPRPEASQEDAMRQRVRECVTWAFERHRDGFDTAVEFELQRRRAQRTAQRYVDWLIVQSKRAPFVVIGREVPASLELGSQSFVGFIDRLDRDERSGAIGVIDYKTGSIATTAAEYRDKIRTFKDFQLPFYYWARTEAGDNVTSLALIPLKDARLDIRPIVVEVDGATAGDLNQARERMIELSGDLASGRARSFRVAKDPDACTFCAYVQACAHKPAPKQERFDR